MMTAHIFSGAAVCLCSDAASFVTGRLRLSMGDFWPAVSTNKPAGETRQGLK
jgi:hypothetical protein